MPRFYLTPKELDKTVCVYEGSAWYRVKKVTESDNPNFPVKVTFYGNYTVEYREDSKLFCKKFGDS